MQTKNWDRFIMLLSSDCFFETWEAIGVDLEPLARNQVQSAARQAVREFMGAATVYWNISFAGARMARTRMFFLDLLSSSKVPRISIESVISAADELLGELSDDDIQKTLFLFYSLTADLLQNLDSISGPRELSEIDVGFIRDAFEKALTATSRNEFESLLVSSNTPWDKYLKNLTPDLPTFLSDWLASVVTIGSTFRLYWSYLRVRLKRTSLDTLLAWYDSEARRRAGHDAQLKVPTWMTEEK